MVVPGSMGTASYVLVGTGRALEEKKGEQYKDCREQGEQENQEQG